MGLVDLIFILYVLGLRYFVCGLKVMVLVVLVCLGGYYEEF